MRVFLFIVILGLAGQLIAGEEKVVYRISDGVIIARHDKSAKFPDGISSGLAVITVTDLAAEATHINETTAPPANRKKVVQQKKVKDVTADTVSEVDALIEEVSDSKTKNALKALRNLIAEELPAE